MMIGDTYGFDFKFCAAPLQRPNIKTGVGRCRARGESRRRPPSGHHQQKRTATKLKKASRRKNRGK